jgi:membrane-associated protease RseP (regulator of RpoE activity)
VTLVLDTSPVGRAGLACGDSILAIDGSPVASPPLFGRAIHGLKAGAPFTLSVRRGAATVELAGQVGRASEVVPPYEQREIGAKLPAFTASMDGAPVAIGTPAGETGPAVTLVLLFDPRRPDTLRDAPVLEWIGEHHAKEQVALAAIGAHASAAKLQEAVTGLACRWPAAADPDGRLTEATRTLQLPDLLVADRDGVVRLRQAHGGELERVVRKLLAERR